MLQRSCSIINPLLIAIYVSDINGDFLDFHSKCTYKSLVIKQLSNR